MSHCSTKQAVTGLTVGDCEVIQQALGLAAQKVDQSCPTQYARNADEHERLYRIKLDNAATIEAAKSKVIALKRRLKAGGAA